VKRVLQILFFVTIALILQYFYLEGHPAIAVSGHYKPFQYSGSGYILEADFPSGTEINLTPDKGEELKLNIYFLNPRLKFRGYIQIWQLQQDLPSFLANSKTNSVYNFLNYKVYEVGVNDFSGLKEEWSADFGDQIISAQEYWLEIPGEQKFIRVAFYTDSDQFPESVDLATAKIINSLNYRGFKSSQ
jgi:hypothetical protein